MRKDGESGRFYAAREAAKNKGDTMQLSFGSGNAAAILDLASCQVEMYNKGGLEANSFHARFGGRQYYASQSGLSGAGSPSSTSVVLTPSFSAMTCAGMIDVAAKMKTMYSTVASEI